MASTQNLTRKIAKLDLTDEIIVLVGPQEKRFVVHKDVLMTNSTSFKAALEKGRSLEAEEKLIRLPEDDPEIFAIYAQYGYRGEIVLPDVQEAGDNATLKQQEFFAKLYIMAHQKGNTTLQNKCIDEYLSFLNTTGKGPTLPIADLAYKSLPETSVLRKLVLDWYLANVQMDWLKDNINQAPDAFIKDLVIGFGNAAVQGTRPKAPFLRERSEYYVSESPPPYDTIAQEKGKGD